LRVMRSVERRPGATEVLALGDPDYGSRSKGPRTLIRGRPLPSLPATRGEVQAVGTVVLLGAQASEGKLRASLASKPRWRAVHLACHSLIDSKQPLLSALALASDGADDGRLTAIEILRLDIPADLVVLSATRAARGRIDPGEGSVGLPRAFLYAGARAVLAPLGAVDDEATSALMKIFYLLWRPPVPAGATPRSAAVALRAAMAQVAAQPRWKHPYYWAGWVLFGDPD
jgi:CHAT domain-containing protein